MSLDIFKAHSGLAFHPDSLKNICFYGPEFKERRDNGDAFDEIFHRGLDLSCVRCDEHGVKLEQEYLDMLPPPPPEDDSDSDTEESVEEEREESVREESEESVREKSEDSESEEVSSPLSRED